MYTLSFTNVDHQKGLQEDSKTANVHTATATGNMFISNANNVSDKKGDKRGRNNVQRFQWPKKTKLPLEFNENQFFVQSDRQLSVFSSFVCVCVCVCVCVFGLEVCRQATGPKGQITCLSPPCWCSAVCRRWTVRTGSGSCAAPGTQWWRNKLLQCILVV